MNQSRATGTVWITGAGSGLGRALSRKMASEGWQVWASARSTDELNSLAAEASSLPGTITALPCDITDQNAINAAIERMEAVAPLDMAVLNAGTHKPTHAADMKIDDFQALSDINLIGTIACLIGVLERMKPRRAGQIAVVSSVAGYRGLPGAAAYGMTKAGLINMTEALQPECKALGITLQIVNPGFIRTPLTDKNDFDMPMMMDVEPAADAFYKGLMSGRFEIIFPRLFCWLTKFFRILPYGLALRLSRRLVRKS